MATLQLNTPDGMGTRDLVKAWLASAISADLSGNVIEVNCAPLRSVTPSFVDELLKTLVVDRHASKVVLVNATDRATTLAERVARNRSIEEQLEIVRAPERQRILSRLRR